MSDVDGCGSHSCKIKPPAGQGVNGPCTCWMRVPDLVAEVSALNDQLDEQDREIERLRAALRAIAACDERDDMDVAMQMAKEALGDE